MTDKAELPDEIWASTLVVTDDDPNMVMGFWGPRRFKDGVRYILADIADELRKSRDHHASTIFIQEGRIASQASEIAALKAKLAHYTYKTDPYAPENKHQLDDMAEHITAQAAEIAALKAVDAKVGAVLAEQDRDYAEKTNRMLERHAAQLASQAFEIAAHKSHIVKLYSKLENRAREFSPGDKS